MRVAKCVVVLIHWIIAQALGKYYIDVVLYQGGNISESRQLDLPFALLYVLKLFRMETVRLMGRLFGG